MTLTSYLLIALAGTCLLVALHPFVTYPLSLWLLKLFHSGKPQAARGARAGERIAMASPPSVAVCLCVHNEAKILAQRLENLLSMTETRAATEILVYSDGSTDETNDILRGFEDRITVLVNEQRQGKTFGMNQLVARTSADLIVFTDAAVLMPERALDAMVESFIDDSVGCVCARIVAVAPDTTTAPTATTQTSAKYWAFDATIRRLESELASVMGAHGPLFAIRRALHVPPPADLIDDFMVSMSVLHNGHRVVQSEYFIGYKAVAPKGSDEFSRKARIACQSFNAHRAMAAPRANQSALVQYFYASHKTLKWLSIFSLAGAAVFTSLALLVNGYTALVGVLLVGAAGIVGLGALGVKPFTQICSALLALLGTGLGVWQSIRGQRYQTWSSPQSARHTG